MTKTSLSDGNLPAEPNSFVGRERDLAELARLLSDVRALTLCGPGGIGKTRLALRLACEVVPGFPDGAWLVELADTQDPSQVTRRVAAALGVREEPDRPLAETLTEALRPRLLLLILDTCEHVVDASAALVHHLLMGCPRLRVIATSREPLRVRGETLWRVPPLALPAAAQELPVGELARHEAIRLFADRAAAVRPGFALDSGNSGAVLRLCRTLDGMPLAIELAAARVGALSVEQIAARLGDRFQLLASGDRTAPPRQQTLRAAVDWSYELLTEPEQVLLRRLAVFSGWNLEMAEQVCAGDVIPPDQVLDLLAALIDKSLVALDTEVGGTARYRLLDTIREYAAGRLTASGEGPAMRLRHRDYMLRVLEDLVDRGFVRGDPPWPERVAMYHRVSVVERANFLAALSASLEHGDAEQGLRLCSALRTPWVAYGDVTEGIAWFDRFLGLDGEVPPGVRARALITRADLAFEQQDYVTAAEYARAGLDLCRASASPGATGALRVLAVVALRAGHHEDALARIDSAIEAARADRDEWNEGLALAVRATVIARLGRLREAQRVYEDALDVLRDNNGWGVAQTLYGFGGLARARGDHEAALAHFRNALALYRDVDARPEIARCLAGIGWVALSRLQAGPRAASEHDLELARSSLTESLELSLATGQRLAVARGLEAFATLAVVCGDLARAVRLEGAALALREAVGHVPSAPARTRLDDLLDSARRQLGPSAAEALLAEGAAMSADGAVRFATGSQGGEFAGDGARPAAPPQAAPPLSSGAPSTLTAREREIAALIARGLSNRGIAAELVISPATAARHVANIFTKLGFSSRAQLAAWAAQREPGDQG
jgi:predicted ATPase/DNA-binding CsgD family transcriptional regulator/Tfp pilus assembly protein PilF